MLIKLIVALLVVLAPAPHDYEAWTSDGVHLFICDAGTPGNYEDDYVFDWETNRDYDVVVND